jgi:hypothetical protein
MGLHIYAGPLCRYFSNDWENEIAQWARANGHNYKDQYGDDGEPSWPTPADAVAQSARLRDTIAATLKISDPDPLWIEEVGEYVTVKLHEESRWALGMVSASLWRPDLVRSTKMPPDPYLDAAYAEAHTQDYKWEAIAPFEASLIVPGRSDILTVVEDPLGQSRLVCATNVVRRALDKLKTEFWGGKVAPNVWLSRGLAWGLNARSEELIDGEWVVAPEPQPSDAVKGNAEFGYAVLDYMLNYSESRSVPIITSW